MGRIPASPGPQTNSNRAKGYEGFQKWKMCPTVCLLRSSRRKCDGICVVRSAADPKPLGQEAGRRQSLTPRHVPLPATPGICTPVTGSTWSHPSEVTWSYQEHSDCFGVINRRTTPKFMIFWYHHFWYSFYFNGSNSILLFWGGYNQTHLNTWIWGNANFFWVASMKLLCWGNKHSSMYL